ncbi:hypothetical protein EVJ50_02435 [Synechococcus sp. RSCCF101]|uniref:DUF6737 family protein n=1 Tax=Synechococcus sp. RSCCF101 TaxID=2511069 RepID=UPI001247FC5D|nr:DUF6737 family protein [Synechococcus sp. RSCCF101]QEY31272.1 hypothetical protein EVJ50_02435 [Synechococcus sp. RSCCF101]
MSAPSQDQPSAAPAGTGSGTDGGFWSHKPWWCQPWTLLLTGSAMIAGSWLLLHRIWLSSLVGLAVLGWWTLFLVLAPIVHEQGTLRGPDA